MKKRHIFRAIDMRSLCLVVMTPLILIAIVLTGIMVSGEELFIESRESKTLTGQPVFNKIKWFRFKDKDVWMMNQSHHGANAADSSWDRLAIVVDKTTSPKVARFYQLAPGELRWTNNIPEQSMRVSCFLCHNNGPRALRPNWSSSTVSLSMADRIQVALWNTRMKFYGRIVLSPEHDMRDKQQIPPVRFRSLYENEHLMIKTCVMCHKDKGFFARGFLSRQQARTIQFMTESGEMPPVGFRLSDDEKQQLHRFLKGF
ncbi:MAG: cytochrome c [Bdellovibrionaceae bacterium]|nr:cytochrome c [Pseudobdellovibrionaceae bacterium]